MRSEHHKVGRPAGRNKPVRVPLFIYPKNNAAYQSFVELDADQALVQALLVQGAETAYKDVKEWFVNGGEERDMADLPVPNVGQTTQPRVRIDIYFYQNRPAQHRLLVIRDEFRALDPKRHLWQIFLRTSLVYGMRSESGRRLITTFRRDKIVESEEILISAAA